MTNTAIAIAGVTGRMGTSIVKAALNDDSIDIASATARPQSDLVGEDIGVVAGIKRQGVDIVEALTANFDVLIDFTAPNYTLENLKFCRENGRALLIGTTGFSPEQRQAIESAANEIPLILASNTSSGVSVLLDLVGRATHALAQEADIEVVEAHHRHKVDAPSGTALTIGETIAKSLGQPLDKVATYERYGDVGAREKGSVGFSVVRGGDVVGEHSVVFYMDGERVEISHKATDRMIFARGAIRAAKWLSAQDAGLYSMNDVLGIT